MSEYAPSALERNRTSDISIARFAGATGASGLLVYKELMGREGVKVIPAVRNLEKAKKLGIKDAVQIDVTNEPQTIAANLAGVDAVVCATGFVPGNPLKMAKAAHAVGCTLLASHTPHTLDLCVDGSHNFDETCH